MAESSSSSWISLGRDSPTVSPSNLVVEGDMPFTSSGNRPCNSPEVRTGDLVVHCMEKLHSYLDTAAKCSAHVQEMTSRKFNDEQCEYLVGKLKVSLYWGKVFLRFLTAQRALELRTSEDMTRCIEVFKLFLALAFKIESFIEGCCRDDWLQAAMTLTNTAEYVSSLGFDLELCRIYFISGWTATNDPALIRNFTAAEVASIEREEVEIVNRKAFSDLDVVLDKVILEWRSSPAEERDLALCVLRRLRSLKPVSTSLLPELPSGKSSVCFGFVREISKEVRVVQLGEGTSGIVQRTLWFGVPVAKKTFYGPEHPDYLKEVQILAGLCHPNIISMFCCAMDRRRCKCSIVMELMDEDLHSFMQRRLDANPDPPPFSIFEAVDVILQIGEGARYLHENGIVHRDLKSFNILVKNILPPDLEVQYVLIKVADFGLAKIKESSTRYSDQGSNIGTSRWMAPEVINLLNHDGQTSSSVLEAEPKYPKKSDVYSFGMVCYEILTGDVPFPHETSLKDIKKKVLKGERPTLPDYCPSILKALIEACWDPKPTERPSFASICSSVKHLKCLLMSGFNSNEDSLVVIREPLQMSPVITLFGAPAREMVV